MQGLIARGKKANIVAKHVNRYMVVNTRIYKNRVEPSTLGLNHCSHSTIPTEPVSSIPERVTRVLDLNPTPHNDPPSSIVVALQNSHTSLQDNGGLINKSDTLGSHIKALDCNQLTLADDIVTPKGVRSDCNLLLCGGGNMNEPSEVLNKHLSDGVSTLQTTMKSDVMNGHQDMASIEVKSSCVLLYDVNAGNTDFSIELCNTLLKDG